MGEVHVKKKDKEEFLACVEGVSVLLDAYIGSTLDDAKGSITAEILDQLRVLQITRNCLEQMEEHLETS